MPKKLFIISLLIFSLFSQTLFGASTGIQINNLRYFNERFAVQSLVIISAAQATYQATIGNGNYGSMNDLLEAGFIDSVLASGDKYGYSFAVIFTHTTATMPARFYATATPRRYPKTGRRSFYIDQTGELRGADKNGAVATISDPTVDSCVMSGFSNEYCTILAMRTLHGAQITYQATVGAGTFGTLQQLYAAGLIRQSMASGTNHGYNFTCQTIAPSTDLPAFFKITAVPVNYGITGFRSFYVDGNGVIRGADKNGAPADENDPPIED